MAHRECQYIVNIVKIPSPHLPSQTPRQGRLPVGSRLRSLGGNGFALVSVLAILALLLVLVLSISSVLHVESRASASGKNLLLARQNALLGMDTAISQLQEYAGKDQAVTFPATAAYPTRNSGNATGALFDDATVGYRAKAATAPRDTYLTHTERTDWDLALQTWWNSGRNPRWLGIADASLRRDGTPSDKFGEPKRDQLVAWLVSGNEKFTLNGTMTSYPSGYQTPEDQSLPDPAPGNDSVWLVGNGTVSTTSNATDGLEPRVKARKVAITSTSSGNATGHFAYWVGDESTKANFAVLDPWFGETNPSSSQYRNRLQVPQRIGWENIARSGASGNTTLSSIASFDINDTRLENISTSEEIGLLEAVANSGDQAKTSAMQAAAKNNFHSLTAFSRSLLTDTALGGLKKDLTVFFDGGTTSLSGTIPNFSLYDSSDPRFGGSSNNGFPRNVAATAGLPTWQQLKAWYDNDQNERAPVLANYQVFIAFTHKNGEIQFHLLPCIAMWNPYDTPLTSSTYTLKIRHNFGLWNFGLAVKDGVDPTPANLDDGRVITTSGNVTYYVPPLNRTGWHAASGKFGTSFPSNPWDATLSANRANPAGSGGTNRAGPPGSSRFAPFDLGSSLPDSTNSNATWVPYQFTSGFAPGEVKIFSVGTSQEVNPAQLHSGAQEIVMTNDFEPDFPASAWFSFASGLTKDGVAQPASSDEVRWYGQILTGNTPITCAMKLLRGGQPLWEYQFTGYPGIDRWTWSRDFVSTADDPDVNYADDPATWKRVYHQDQWGGVAKGSNDARLRNSPAMGWVSVRINPFVVANSKSLYDSGNYQQEGLANYHRAFAHSNLSAKTANLMPDLDYVRASIGNNNQDGFATRSVFQSQAADSEVKWDFNNVDGTNGFALVGWQKEDVNRKNLGLSTVPLRQARASFELLSLGQLQQANLAEYYWQPGFAIGNSEASPYVDRARAAGLQSYDVGNAKAANQMILPNTSIPPNTARKFPNDATNRFLDLSFTLNENLWDRYFLSSVPQSGALETDNSQPLPNSRHRFVASPSTSDVRDFHTTAAHMENFGAFNVNSTSVQAWKALLTAFRDLAIVSSGGQRNPGDTVPVSRNLAPLEGPINFTDSTQTPSDYGAVATGRNYSRLLFGFRYLTDTQIQRLSERIVDEVRLRGPFYSLADFVNRRLVPPDLSGGYWLAARTSNQSPTANFSKTHAINSAYNPLAGMAGLNGALQRAINLSGINGGVNYPFATSTNDRAYAVDLNPAQSNQLRMQQYSEPAGYLDSEHLAGVPAGEPGQLLSHAPGFLSQADLLAMIGPALTPRGDTFLVRSYGDAVDRNGRVIARAYLEAVVQRVAEPLNPKGSSGLDRWTPSDKFGRKFKIVSLRWLNPEEV